MTTRARKNLVAKNHDYSSNTDPLANLRSCQYLEVTPQQGVLVRIQDKISRLHNIGSKGGAKVNESIADTCEDIINYVVLYKALEEYRNSSYYPPMDVTGSTIQSPPKFL